MNMFRILTAVLLATFVMNGVSCGQGETRAAPTEPAEAATVQLEGMVVRPDSGTNDVDLDKAWDEYNAAIGKVAESFRTAITKQFDAAAAKGDLDSAEKWQRAAERFESSGAIPRHPELKATIFAAQNRLKEAEQDLLDAYEAAIKTLTKEKNIDGAKAVRAEREIAVRQRVGQAGRDAATAKQSNSATAQSGKSSSTPVWKDITNEMSGGTRRGAVVVIRPNGERVVSDKPYAPPIEIEYVCATSRNNIRLSYACDYLIFNWELNRSELRIDGGPAAGRHVPNAGSVPTGQMVTIRQVVMPNGMEVFVDGQRRASWAGDFSRVRELIEVFGHDSELQLKSVRVRKLNP